MRILRNRKAQSITEYAVLSGVVIMAVVLMQVYLKRSVQGKFKDTADQIGEQFSTGETYSTQTIQQSLRNEVSGVRTDVAELSKAWSKSTVIATASIGTNPQAYIPTDWGYVEATPELASFAKGEVTVNDYVSVATGADAIGTHTAFRSGVLQDKKIGSEATGGTAP